MEARHDLMFEEDIHITVSGLTRYVHHLEEMHISLQVADFGSDFVGFFPDLDVSRGRLFL